MANTLLTPSIIASESALQVVNNLVFGRLANKSFKEDFGVKVGSTISYRKPIRFQANSGATLVVQDVSETSDTIVINSRYHVAWQFLSQDLTLTIDQYAERYIRPAAIQLAQQIDQDGSALYTDIYQAIGTAATSPSFGTILGARGYLNSMAVPLNDRYLAVNPVGTTAILNGMTSFLQESLIEDITKEASVGRLGGTDIFESPNINLHTKGTGNTVVVSTTSSEGDTSISMTAASGTLVTGDVITIDSVNAVNPLSKNTFSTLVGGGSVVNPQPQQFVVQNGPYTLSGTPVSVDVSPVIRSTGPYQTVDALPQANAAVTIVGTHTPNVMFQRNCFSLVTVPVVSPQGAVWSETVEYQGLGLRFLRAYDPTNDVEIARLDVLYGWKTTYPELGIRVLG
jgi:hypothetical protein